MMKIYKLLSLLSVLISIRTSAQDDLLSMFDEGPATTYAQATFKATHVVLGQSIENPKNGVMNALIQHQFGSMADGYYELWGLDQAIIRLGLEYGVNDWLGLGLGRSSFNKTVDGYAKIKLLRQSSGKRNMPVSVSYFGGIYMNTLKWENQERDNLISNKLSYAHELLIARKINENLSIQLTPGVIHRNLVESVDDENDVMFAGISGRYKITTRFSINLEYFYLLPGNTADHFENSFSVGFDIETGGHVFQIYVSNSQGIQDPYFIAQTTEKWEDGAIHLAFNLNRNFTIKKPKSFQD